jgi:hypothetical protein
MRRIVLVAVSAAMLALAGCGGGDSDEGADPVARVAEEGGLQEKVRAAATPDESIFPPSQGKTLEQVAEEVRGGGATEVGLASSVFTTGGENRLAFGVIDDQGQFVYGETAVYVAPTPQEPAKGPFVAPADVLVTEGRYRSKQAATESDPFAAVYQAQIPLNRKGSWSILTVTRQGNTWLAAPAQIEVRTPKADKIPDVGEPAPKVATDTLETADGDVENIDTRVPPSDMHAASFDDVVGTKPVALLFATPQLCQSRVCGPVVDVALQLRARYGDQAEFIHQEVYAGNDPSKGLRKPLQEFNLATEPWLFAVGEDGKITARLEGSFGLDAVERALRSAL